MLVEYGGHLRAILREFNDFGFAACDVVSLPARLQAVTGATSQAPAVVEASIDRRRLRAIPTPAALAVKRTLEEGDNWLAMSQRGLARAYAAFLVAEDPQHRLDARKAATLMHQVSLVQHILDRPNLRKVLIGDEVGLGKTIEAGLLMRRLIDQDPETRILYLAPARLVRNVVHELRDKLDIDARAWVAGPVSDARLASDRVVVASIHKAVAPTNFDTVAASGPWDCLIVDECHHLSDWNPNGGQPNQSFRLVSQLLRGLGDKGRLVLMSGTPHQGNEARFRNILRLLSDDGRSVAGAAGRVIFRTKDRVRDWRGQPLFPSRDIRQPLVVDLGTAYEQWYRRIGEMYDAADDAGQARARAAGWAKGQALQWAASSVQAGIGFLVRLAMRRLGWTLTHPALRQAVSALRPYRGGRPDEPVDELFDRLARQIGIRVSDDASFDDMEPLDDEWIPDPDGLASLLREGVALLSSDESQAKWEAVRQLIDQADGEKIVLFAQPVETVTVVASFLERTYGVRPSVIIGNQAEDERLEEVARFQRDDGPRFLVSSRAGGEGLNMQRARRLIHLDVPWNPMDMEQRIGRIHRFGSRRTVVVDTVVARGSREVDMYRVARHKLKTIAQQLDPDQFETLFSRVMSLVPPRDLENLLADMTTGLAGEDASEDEIGRLVSQGFQSWSEFDDTYRQQADLIRATEPGEATWADVGHFLVKHGGADEGAKGTFGTFRFQDDEIVAVEELVSVIRVGDRQFACGDTGGLRAVSDAGNELAPLGLNVSAVQSALAKDFSIAQRTGLAVVNRPAGLPFLGEEASPTVVMFFLRHRLVQERGVWSEAGIGLHAYCVRASGDAIELDAKQRAHLVRACQSTPRVRDASAVELRQDLVDIEADLITGLRVPSDHEPAAGIRYAVWPLALIVLVP